MALNIANRKVEEKAIQACRILGVNKTAAVEAALDYYLERHRTEKERTADHQKVSRLLDELTKLPILDDRQPDEIIGYYDDFTFVKKREDNMPLSVFLT